MPTLRERRDDIPLLVRHFLDQLASDNDRSQIDIAPEASEALRNYAWPGNVRELANTLEGIVVLSTRDRIELSDLPDYITGFASAQALIQPGMTIREIEKEAIRRALLQTGGHRSQAAEILDISVRTLQRKVKEYNLQVD